jgi:hypothetical protein
MDVIIAATALAHDLTVWTQDEDFEVLAQLAPALRVQHLEPRPLLDRRVVLVQPERKSHGDR